MSGTAKITAATSKEHLPNDTDTLKEMVLTLLGQIDDLSGQLYYLKRQLFGKKSEKLSPGQRLLFENLYQEVEAKIEQQKQPAPEPVQENRASTHKGRNPLPADLRREIIPIDPSEEDKFCDIHHKPKTFIGTEETEKLEYIPASFFVKVYVRSKYACEDCQGNISIGELPAMAIDKGIAGEGLLAHIITSKFADHLPLNRLEGIFKRHGVDINVSTPLGIKVQYGIAACCIPANHIVFHYLQHCFHFVASSSQSGQFGVRICHFLCHFRVQISFNSVLCIEKSSINMLIRPFLWRSIATADKVYPPHSPS